MSGVPLVASQPLLGIINEAPQRPWSNSVDKNSRGRKFINVQLKEQLDKFRRRTFPPSVADTMWRHDALMARFDEIERRLAALPEVERKLAALPEIEIDALHLALQQKRLILTDYAYDPHERPLAVAASGRLLTERFELEEPHYADTLRGIAKHIDSLASIPREASQPLAPLWNNPWFPPFDGASLYGLIAENHPGRYIEVGSGISTRFARQAICDLGLETRIISIDPHPHNAIEGLCDEIIVSRMEDMPSSFWEGLSANDMMFVDISHRSFPGSDVTVFFAEVMPALAAGSLFGIHDIFLPYDYPEVWKERFYNEQYLLMTYLLGGGGRDSIVLPVHWATGRPGLRNILAPLWEHQELFSDLNIGGGCFWLRRGRGA
jgi:hypothetical protein